jgi:hypothetical protein
MSRRTDASPSASARVDQNIMTMTDLRPPSRNLIGEESDTAPFVNYAVGLDRQVGGPRKHESCSPKLDVIGVLGRSMETSTFNHRSPW